MSGAARPWADELAEMRRDALAARRQLDRRRVAPADRANGALGLLLLMLKHPDCTLERFQQVEQMLAEVFGCRFAYTEAGGWRGVPVR